MFKLVNYADASAGIKEFVADTQNDLKSIKDCEMGSTCLIISTHEFFIRNGKGEWVLWT